MVVVAILIAALLALAIANIVRARAEPLVERVGGFVSLRSSLAGSEPAGRRSILRSRSRFLKRRGAVLRKGWTDRLAPTLELAGIVQTPVEVILLTLAAAVLGALSST